MDLFIEMVAFLLSFAGTSEAQMPGMGGGMMGGMMLMHVILWAAVIAVLIALVVFLLRKTR
jgi:uncharacterized membrane protein